GGDPGEAIANVDVAADNAVGHERGTGAGKGYEAPVRRNSRVEDGARAQCSIGIDAYRRRCGAAELIEDAIAVNVAVEQEDAAVFPAGIGHTGRKCDEATVGSNCRALGQWIRTWGYARTELAGRGRLGLAEEDAAVGDGQAAVVDDRRCVGGEVQASRQLLPTAPAEHAH